MRVRTIAIMVVGLLSSSAFSAPPLVITSGGVFVISGNGVPTFSPWSGSGYDGVVLDLRGETPPPPPPPGDLAKKIESWARETGQPTVAKALATYTGMLLDALRADKMKASDVPRSLKAGFDAVTGDAWKTFRQNFNSIAPANPDKAEALVILEALQTGLANYGESVAVEEITLPELLDLLIKLFQLLRDLGIIK